MLLAGLITHQDQLLIYGPGFDLANIFILSNEIERIIAMLADNEPRIALLDAAGEFNHAKIAVGNPDIIGNNGFKHGFQQ